MTAARSSPRRRLLAAALVLCLVVAAFGTLEFQAAAGQTAGTESVSTGSLGDATADLAGTVTLYVAGESGLDAALREDLAADLRDRGLAVETPDSLRPDADGPVLVVAVVDREVRYNPVRPSADLSWRFLYVASGNVSQFGRPADDPAAGEFDPGLLVDRLREDDLAPFRMGGGVRFVRAGTLSLSDRRTGVVSWPGYRGHLAAELSDRTLDAVTA